MTSLTADEFVRRWQHILEDPPQGAQEKALSQQHFVDLCDLVGHPRPTDPTFRFEKPVAKISGEKGFADVWKRGFFGWEYKGPHKDLNAAYVQLKTYADALENPPLLVVSDLKRIRIHTNFTATIKQEYELSIDQLVDPKFLQLLKWLFNEPEKLKPGVTRAVITREAADKFGDIALSVAKRYDDPQRVAHFLNRIIFSFFAEDIGILPDHIFSKLIEVGATEPGQFATMCRDLFEAMAKGGRIGWVPVAHFNGGLFDSDDVLELTGAELAQLQTASKLDWSSIEPAIFGTLFERFLDPDKRSQIGAFYTDPDTIMRIVRPVVLEPLEDEWTAVKADLEKLMTKAAETGAAATKARNKAQDRYHLFLDRLKHFSVLDPACGSGNFLYLSLRTLKDFERRVRNDAALMGLASGVLFETGPHNLHGIEINHYAAELARISIWIGEIQWMIENGYGYKSDPVLGTLDQIETRDAILNDDGTEAAWPRVDVIVGNPPFLGDRRMRGSLSDHYVDRLRARYDDRLPHGADLVCYWLEKARAAVSDRKADYAGLVATNSIRGGKNRVVIDRIMDGLVLTDAWSDEPWILDGAAVRVSIVVFSREVRRNSRLNGKPVAQINADLSSGGIDLTRARGLAANDGVMLHGSKKIGSFDILGDEARRLLAISGNPHGRPNSDVLTPCWNGADITGRNRDFWIIDFGLTMTEAEASQYEAPFAIVTERVKPERMLNRNPDLVMHWWRHGGPRPAMRKLLPRLSRVLVTPALAKHRVWKWVPKGILPDAQLMVALRDDDQVFGILHSRFHELWSLRLGSSLEDRPRYTPKSSFETFPFPRGLTPDLSPVAYINSHAAAIGAIAAHLNDLRENWLNPPEWVDRVPEVVPGYPDRIIAKPGHEADLKKRTLTNLYNARPAWLDNAHRELDIAVAKAYGWDDYKLEMPDEEILRRLLDLNLSRTSAR